MVLRFFMLAVAFFLSCTEVERDKFCDEKSIYYENSIHSKGATRTTFSDSRDGEDYSEVQIWQPEGCRRVGLIVFMDSPLRFNAPGSICDEDEVKSNGCKYDWETAMTVCPPDWHLPSDRELEELWESINTKVGRAPSFLSSVSFFTGPSYYWTSTDKDANNAYFRHRIGYFKWETHTMSSYEFRRESGDKNDLLSVICVQDQPESELPMAKIRISELMKNGGIFK